MSYKTQFGRYEVIDSDGHSKWFKNRDSAESYFKEYSYRFKQDAECGDSVKLVDMHINKVLKEIVF